MLSLSRPTPRTPAILRSCCVRQECDAVERRKGVQKCCSHSEQPPTHIPAATTAIDATTTSSFLVWSLASTSDRLSPSRRHHQPGQVCVECTSLCFGSDMIHHNHCNILCCKASIRGTPHHPTPTHTVVRIAPVPTAAHGPSPISCTVSAGGAPPLRCIGQYCA
jgi:hypothetical protein